MLKLSSLLFVLILLSVACVKTEESSVVSGGTTVSNSPIFWNGDPFPLAIHMADSFTNDEYDAIKETAEKWETNVGNKDWFDFQTARITETTTISGGTVSQVTSAINTLNNDGIIGVYKTNPWPYDISILAQVNLLLMVYNRYTANQYAVIQKADMLFNTHHNNFRVNAGGVYDIRTVALHEFAHVLGMQHTEQYPTSLKATSVMYPSISSSDNRRDPFQADINKLADLYNINLSQPLHGAMATRAPASESRFIPFDDGEAVLMEVELRKDGECVHKENGEIVHRHHPHR